MSQLSAVGSAPDERPVRADIVFARQTLSVFVDCWLRHSCPEHGTTPRRCADHSVFKLARDVERDREQDAALRDAGWTAVRIWEHEPIATAKEVVLAVLG